MITTPRSAAERGEENATGSPSRTTCPVDGCSMPDKIFISVDLPAPFSPKSAMTRPECTSSDTPFSAWVPP